MLNRRIISFKHACQQTTRKMARSKKGNAYISLTLDCPSFAAPMHCNLVQSQRGYALRWDRKRPDGESARAGKYPSLSGAEL